MKKIAVLLTILLLTSATLVAGLYIGGYLTPGSDTAPIVTPIPEETPVPSEEPASPEGSVPADGQGTASGQVSEEPEQIGMPREYSCAYEQLTGKEQEVYLQICSALKDFREVKVSTTDRDLLEKVYSYCMADHPEIFYVGGFTFTDRQVGGVSTEFTFRGNYLFTKEETQALREEIELASDRILSGIPDPSSDYAAAKYLYETIVRMTEYDPDAQYNQNIVSVFTSGRSVCNGYSKALQYLLQRAGIEAMTVSGQSRGSSHAWVVARLDGDFYHIDVTWGDASFSGEDAGTAAPGDWINYDYLCVTTGDISATHTASDEVPVPECSADADNYYVREGRYVTVFNEELLRDIFRTPQQVTQDGGSVYSLRASHEVYEDLTRELVENSGIYRFIDTPGQVHYTSDPDMRTMTFFVSGG